MGAFQDISTGYATTGALPGNVQLGFRAFKSGSFMTSSRVCTGGKRGSGYLELKMVLVTQPKLWDQINGSLATGLIFGSAQSSGHRGNSFGTAYMAFEFKDSTLTGSPMRYGWVQLSFLNGNLASGGDYPRLTVYGWAYDNTGAQIPMGATVAVPEPSSMALLALGALTLGATGVRSWRRNRAASQS